jgi:four helix bundle protein
MPTRSRVKAKTLEDLVVYREAIAAEDAVSAILARAVFNKDLDLRGQLSRSSSRIAPLIAEGFGQLTDRHVAVYLGRARGSALETTVHLRKAHAKQFVSDAESSALAARYNTIGKRLTKWIRPWTPTIAYGQDHRPQTVAYRPTTDFISPPSAESSAAGTTANRPGPPAEEREHRSGRSRLS